MLHNYMGTNVHIRGGNEMLHIQAQVFIRGVGGVVT